MPKYVNIAVPIPTDNLFTYSVDHLEINDAEIIGRRAIVPFGRKKMTGFILGIVEEPSYPKIKKVIEIIDDTPVFSKNMLKLAAWISDYYISSIGETLRAMLPAGMIADTATKIRWIRIPTENEMKLLAKRAPVRAAIIDNLKDFKGFISVRTIEKKCGSTISNSQLEWLREKGYIEISEEMTKIQTGKKLKAVQITDKYFNDEKLFSAEIDQLEKRSLKASQVLSEIFLNQTENRITFIKTLIEKFNYNHNSIKKLEQKGLLTIYDAENEIKQANEESLAERNEGLLSLTSEQAQTVDAINESIASGKFTPFLLHGITGSGKTLVYIQAIKHVIARNKKAILMVPEISLTPQLIDRFRNVFGEKIAVLHSHLSKSLRYSSWKMIKENRADLVIGARSALFAPMDNLGLIIVDEEHEGSYKQDSPDPRYNGRDSAIVRSKIENCPVVLGSATPSIESMYNAKTGKYKLLEIKYRADGAMLPEIKTVNSFEARKSGQIFGNFTKDMIDAIVPRLKRKEGIILLQNRRGFADLMHCAKCGEIPKCVNCDVSLTFHKTDNTLRCHYCGYKIKKDICKKCQSDDLRLFGSGTQRIEDELAEYLSDKKIDFKTDRFDLDTTSIKGAHRKILRRFATKETNILIGTQMVAKGIDFNHVTLVGVLNADLQMSMPDFRSNEKTFQLLTQVAGRAGRSGKKSGLVIVQSAKPEHKVIQAVMNSNYEQFYQDEIRVREEVEYPPFTRFCKIDFTDKNAEKVKSAAIAFFNSIPRHHSLIIYHPVEPMINRINNNFRYMIIVKSKKEFDQTGKILRDILRISKNKFMQIKGFSGVRLTIDIDAISGM